MDENEGTENTENQEKEEEKEEIESAGDQVQDLDFILDIPLELSVELGKTRMLINDLLQLGQGSIVELNKLAGEPLEVYINHKLIARGEVVVVNEKFGVRLTDIITPMDRVKSLST
ncbi:MAG: flagellar motor switch protein FliN [Desulfobacteraceae bacterium]